MNNMKEIQLVVDKRTELAGIIFRLSKYSEKYPHLMREVKDWQYLKDVENYFSKYKNHPAVVILNEILANGDFGYDIPIWLFLQMDEEFNFKGQKLWPFVDELESSELVLKFLQKCKNFALDTNFEEFYKQNEEFYQKQINLFKSQVQIDTILPWLKNFYNFEFADRNFIVNLALLFTNGCYGVNVENYFYDVHSKPVSKSGECYFWGMNDPTESSVTLHEFSHSFINPLTDKYWEKIKKPELSGEKRQLLEDNSYGSLYAYINETIIRAMQILYVEDCGGDYSKMISNDDRIGFDKLMLLRVVRRLEEYRKQPDHNIEKDFVSIANVIAEYNQENN